MQHRKLERLMTPVERIARVAAAGLTSATSSATKPSGAKSYDNADGTRTIIGNVANGESNPSYTMATHVGDTTAPGTPTGVTASSKSGVVVVEWDGTLSGGIPDDFYAVRVYLDGSELGILTGAGSVSSASLEGDTTHSVTATAEDDACLPDGTPAHNVSAPTTAISVTVSEGVESVAAEVEQVRQDVADFRDDVATTYATKVEREDGDDAVKTWVTTNYTNSNDLATTYATKTLVSQTKDAIELAASQTYETQSDAAATYATKSALTVGLDGIRSEVAEDYQPKGDYATTASMNSAIQQSASSIESSVAATYTTKAEFEGLQVGGTNLASDVKLWYGRTASSEYTARGITVKQLGDGLYSATGTTTGGGDIWFQTSYIDASLSRDPGDYVMSVYVESGTWPSKNFFLQLAAYKSSDNTWSRNIRTGNGSTSQAFTCETDYPRHFGFYSNTSGVEVNITFRLKLERGTIATDWSPAPEDAAATYATKTEVQQTASGLDTRITTAQSTANDALADSVEYIIGTQTAATNAWTGETRDAALVAGKTIAYKLPYAGNSSAATLNLTLSGGGTTGAKGVRRMSDNNANNTVTTQYGAGAVVQMTYDGEFWRVSSGYNPLNDINRARYRTQIPSAVKAAAAYTIDHIICGTSAGYKNIGAGVAFDLGYPLLHAAASVAAGATGTANYLELENRNASNNGTIQSGAANKTLYLKGTVSGNTFTIAASPFMTTVTPTSEDGFCYIPLGLMCSATNIYFQSSDQLYAYTEGAFQPIGRGALATAQAEVTERQTLIRQFSGGVLAGYVGNAIAALVNAAGSFDVVQTTWSNGVPTVTDTLARYAANLVEIGKNSTNAVIDFCAGGVRMAYDSARVGFTILSSMRIYLLSEGNSTTNATLEATSTNESTSVSRTASINAHASTNSTSQQIMLEVYEGDGSTEYQSVSLQSAGFRINGGTPTKGVFFGTKVMNVGTNVSTFTLFTKAELQAIVGTSWTPTGANCAVFVMNGDYGATDAMMSASINSSSVVRVHMNKTKTGDTRINYLIVRFGA